MNIKSPLFIACILFAGCKQIYTPSIVPQQSTAAGVVIDITDKKSLWCNADPLLELYQCNKYPDAEAWLQLTVISDKNLNQTFSAHLPNGSVTEKENLNSDPQYRAKSILTFYQNVREQLKSLYSHFDTTKTMEYSQCWISIANEVNKITGISATRKFVIIYSDLCENSPVYNSYKSSKNFDSKAITAKFLVADAIPQNLKDLTVVFIYLPQSRSADKRYNQMLSVYKSIFLPRGANVIVQTNNTEYDVAGN